MKPQPRPDWRRRLLPGQVLRAVSRRYLTRHPWQTWLSVLGIALGVAMVIAVDLANESARRGFQRSLAQVTGPATHRIESASSSIAEGQYILLRREHGLNQAVPVLEAPVRADARGLTLLGLDLIAAATLRPELLRVAPDVGASGAAAGLVRLLTQPGTIALSAPDAEALGVAVGDTLALRIGEGTAQLTVAALLPADSGLTGLAVADIATAQEVLGRLGEFDHIDLILDDAAARRLGDALPPGLELRPAAARSNALTQLTRAFHTNLTAMSLLALLVGGFIVYNTMTFAVLQRRSLLGTLRLQGVTRGQLFLLVAGEAALLAALGALLGVLGGIAAGAGLVQLVTRTINDLYFQTDVRGLTLIPWSLLKGAALGFGVTLLAALPPALEAARSQPRDVLRRNLIERRGRSLLPWLALAGLGTIGLGLVLIAPSARSMTLGFVALFLVIVGASLTMPLVVHGLARATTPLFGALFGMPGRLAARGITASITRSGLAVAALAVAVAATVGVGIMIGSFRASVTDWLEQTLSSDIYVTVGNGERGDRQGALPADLGARLAALPGVVAVSEGRARRVQARAGPVMVLALRGHGDGAPRGFRFRGDTLPELWPRWHAGELVLISEPYAWHQRLGVGDRLELFTTAGWRSFTVGGVFQDYGSDSGMLVLPRPVYASLWQDPAIGTLGLQLAAGADLDAVSAAVQEVLATLPRPASMQTNKAIRALSIEIFERTFTITRVLRLLAVGVAFIGILSALMALELERGRDYAILRATGLTRTQLARLILLQTSAMGIAAGLLAIPLGIGMGSLLITVINLRSFGWTMPMQVSAETLLSGLALAWIAALLAGLWPAWRAARTTPARALRDE